MKDNVEGPGMKKTGDEIGRFLVGSTAIVLLPKGVARWREDLAAGSPLRMGERIGSLN